MRCLSVCAAAAALSAAQVGALQLLKRTDGSALKVVRYDTHRRHVPNHVSHGRSRRRSTISAPLTNEETLYFVNATLGTPPQPLMLHIDTGSSDLWVNVPGNIICQNNPMQCSFAGTYTPGASSTYTYLNSDFDITYVDGSGSSGDYATDTLNIGGVTLENQQFGIGYQSTSPQGLLGIGYTANEASVGYENFGFELMYPNVPQMMMQSGLINSIAYSLWLDDLDSSTGSILFGGVNTAKYTGTLQTLPVIPEQGEYAELIIALTGMGMNGNSGSIASGQKIAALLDSGSTLTYLPDDIVNAIYNAVGARYQEEAGVATIDCSKAQSSDTIDYTFSSPTIRVSMSELVLEAGGDGTENFCVFGIAYANGTTPVLGDTFLRSAYVVYDLSNNQISLAQTNFDAGADNVLEITNATSTDTGVPSASVVQNAVTDAAVITGGARQQDGQLNGITVLSSGVLTALPRLGYAALAAAAVAVGLYFVF